MSNNHQNDRFNTKGYYLTVLLCAGAIGLAGFLYYRNADQTDVQQNVPAAGTTAPESAWHSDVPVIATEAPVATAPQATQPVQKKPLKTASPVSGQEVFGYSMEALSYNQTTRDWRTHNGIDIAADAGTQVVAAADGQVYTTYEDESLGYTVVIRHEGGYTTKYASLGKELSVKAGDQVSMGQVIGTVDETALVETVLGPHLHFSVTYQDEALDPAEFLSLGK